MPPCNKKLKIFEERQEINSIYSRCCLGEGHFGPHEWHIWTDLENEATGKKGMIITING